MSTELYWAWLSSRLGPGSKAMAGVVSLLEKGYDIKELYALKEAELKRFGLFTPAQTSKLSDKSLDAAEKLCESADKLNIKMLCLSDSRYPERLRQIYNPPALLYYSGELPDFVKLACFAIVGTRNASEHGLACAGELAGRLSRAGAVIVSGGAMGIDAAAHRGTLEAGGKTVAVLGCGINYHYYPAGRVLRDKIERAGAVLSEYPPDSNPEPGHFPVRNRIISGLSLCVAVIEGTQKSGSVITANLAIEQGREVFALPGVVGLANTAGVNALLKDGATPLTCANDILTQFVPLYPGRLKSEVNSPALGERRQYTKEQAEADCIEDARLDAERQKRTKKKSLDEKAEPAPIKSEKTALRSEAEGEREEKLLASLSENAVALYRGLGDNELTAQELSECCAMPVHIVMRALTELELMGAVAAVSGMRFKK